MPSSKNRKAVEIPLPLYEALAAIAEGKRDSLARLVAHGLWEWTKEHHPDRAPSHPYLTDQQQQEYYGHYGHGPVKKDGYRRF